jgi:single-stranded DNA-specific DHH superfamily exonuclease
MGQIELATELFLTRDSARGEELAQQLCELNRQRQGVESEIYRQATEMLPADQTPDAIVLSGEDWHQGVVGIVSSRIAEEYCCPTFLICLDGDHGKASSRSFGGFNLFSSLTALSHLLESYGGHELAAGFTIHRSQIPAFREEICRLAEAFYCGSGPKTVLFRCNVSEGRRNADVLRRPSAFSCEIHLSFSGALPFYRELFGYITTPFYIQIVLSRRNYTNYTLFRRITKRKRLSSSYHMG